MPIHLRECLLELVDTWIRFFRWQCANGIYYNVASVCKARSIVAFRARELKRDKKINDTWVSRGMIIIKDKFNKIHSVSALSQLEQFKWI